MRRCLRWTREMHDALNLLRDVFPTLSSSTPYVPSHPVPSHPIHFVPFQGDARCVEFASSRPPPPLPPPTWNQPCMSSPVPSHPLPSIPGRQIDARGVQVAPSRPSHVEIIDPVCPAPSHPIPPFLSSQGDVQSQQQPGSGWIDGGLRERSSGGGGFSGLSAEANGFVPSNFNPAGGAAGVGEIVGGGGGGGIPSGSANNASDASSPTPAGAAAMSMSGAGSRGIDGGGDMPALPAAPSSSAAAPGVQQVKTMWERCCM